MTEPALPRLTNVSNPAAFGVEWSSDGVDHQLVNPKGTTGLWFESRTQHTYPRWIHTDVVRPERFGMTEPPKTFKDFQTIVQAFLTPTGDGNETP